MTIAQTSYGDLPDVSKIQFGEVLGIDLGAPTNTLTHGLHRYPAKFIPQIPRWAIENFSSPGDAVLDPFCGSGTTLVEAIASGRGGVGIDLDPLACLIASAKVQRVSVPRLKELSEEIIERVGNIPSELVPPIAGVKNFDRWFSEAAWAELQSLRRAILSIDMEENERKFFLVVFSSIIRSVSNADDQSQKTYVSGTLKKIPPPVLATFRKKLTRSLEAAGELNSVRKVGASVVCASATSMPIDSGSIDLIVTSPPYLDSMDYMYNLMLEYFWLGENVGIHSRADFNVARKAGIGSKQPADGGHALPQSLAGLIDEVSIPAYRKASIGPYFVEMARHFDEASRVLKPGGRYVLVIGNSRTQSGMLQLHNALIFLAAAAGLHMDHAFAYRIRRHSMKFPRKGRGGIILMDWVITLRKSDSGTASGKMLSLLDDQLHPDAVAH